MRTLTTKQKIENRKQAQQKYYQQNKFRLQQQRRDWGRQTGYDREWYKDHAPEVRRRTKEYYHQVRKIKKAAHYLALGQKVWVKHERQHSAALVKKQLNLTNKQLAQATRLLHAGKTPVQENKP